MTLNVLIVFWTMAFTAGILLGLTQVFLLWHNRQETNYLLSAVMAFAAAAVSFTEMLMFSTSDPAAYQRLLLWQNLNIALVVVPLVLVVRFYQPTARFWLAAAIIALWTIGLLVNFFLPGNLTFSEITSIDRQVTPWGSEYFVPNGTANPFKWLVDITVLLIPLYVIDAAWRRRKSPRYGDGVVVTTGVVAFILLAGAHAIVVDAGMLEMPFMVGPAFLSIVLALTWVLTRDAVRARALDIEVAEAHEETERLMRANLLGEIAAVIAHELNQPLAAILGNAQAGQKMLTTPAPDMEELAAILDDIVRDDKRARDIIQTMRGMLRGDQAAHEPVDLELAVNDVLDFAMKDMQRRAITLHYDTHGPIPRVSGGRVALQQVLLNLLINAERAILQDGASERRIEVMLRGRDGGAELEVRDHGPGIAEGVKDRLFEPFVTTADRGLGMGLVICQRIVEGHGGRLSGANAEDGGARFRLWLPATDH